MTRAQILYRYDISGYYGDVRRDREGRVTWRRTLEPGLFALVGELELGDFPGAPEGGEDRWLSAAERCYALLNADQRPLGFAEQRSMSCGDIAIILGRVYHCASAGFDRLDDGPGAGGPEERERAMVPPGFTRELGALAFVPAAEFWRRAERASHEARLRREPEEGGLSGLA